MQLQIADCLLRVEGGNEILNYLPNLTPFALPETADPSCCPCEVHLGCTLSPCSGTPDMVAMPDGRQIRIWFTRESCRLSLAFPGMAHTYQLEADRHWRQIRTDLCPSLPADYKVLNDLLMLSFIYSAAFSQVVLIHASCIALDKEGVAFLGPSGIGKSTHSRLWLKHIPNTRLLNDDQPALRLLPEGKVLLCGTPWSGKTPCYRNEKVRLRALFQMEQAHENEAVRLTGIQTFRMLLGSSSLMGRDGVSFAAISRTLSQIAGHIPAFLLRNRPEEAAARLSYGLFQQSCMSSKL